MSLFDAPMGEESYQCCQCGGNFDVDWGEGTVTPWLQLELTVGIDTDQ